MDEKYYVIDYVVNGNDVFQAMIRVPAKDTRTKQELLTAYIKKHENDRQDLKKDFRISLGRMLEV
jgi:hypothetical protein